MNDAAKDQADGIDLDNLDLQDLVTLRKKLDEQIDNKRPSAIYEKFLGLIEFLGQNNLRLNEFLEIGETSYQAEHKKKKSPLFQPGPTGKARTLEVKYAHNKNEWAGRGKTPKWLLDEIEKGAKMEDFAVK